MNTKTAQILCKLSTAFYEENALSFSESRYRPWPGWKRAINFIYPDKSQFPNQISVLDLACGNMRFESFLKQNLPQTTLNMYAVDNCPDLLPSAASAQFQDLDIINCLCEDRPLNECIEASMCDLSVSFGFMHHVPGLNFRIELLKALVMHTKPGGYIMVSLWQFLNNESLKNKALITHQKALQTYTDLDLDEGDYLLGWKNIEGTYRYCHSFSETEIDELVKAVSPQATLLARYRSDGRGDNLNTYLILKAKNLSTKVST